METLARLDLQSDAIVGTYPTYFYLCDNSLRYVNHKKGDTMTSRYSYVRSVAMLFIGACVAALGCAAPTPHQQTVVHSPVVAHPWRPTTPSPVPLPQAHLPPVVKPMLPTVHFGKNSATLTVEEQESLKHAASNIIEHYVAPGVKIQVVGTGSSSGSIEYNKQLAARRAWIVADFLSRWGVPKENLQIITHAQSYTPVLVYGATYCDTCTEVRAFLKRIKFPYVFKEVDKDQAARSEMYEHLDRANVPHGLIPVLVVGYKGPEHPSTTVLRGYDEKELHEALDAADRTVDLIPYIEPF